jgi:fructose-bisphosphate aldolase class II
MIVTSKKVLEKANKGYYAVGAFNTSNLEMTKAIVDAATELRSPVIVQTSSKAINYAGIKELSNIIRVIGKNAKVPVILHLDHGPDINLVKQCLKNNWTSIMIDGSQYDFKKNVAITKKAVQLSHKKRVPVEAEIGKLQGVEGWVSVSEKDAIFTDPREAKLFVKQTRCDSLAIAIGTSHGAYKFKGSSNLDFGRLKEIKEEMDIPIVLHGASSVPKDIVNMANKYGAKLKDAKGVSNAHLRKAVKLGINKINTDTDLRIAFDAAIRKELKENPEVFDPRKILAPAIDAIKKIVYQKIKLFGSEGKA